MKIFYLNIFVLKLEICVGIKLSNSMRNDVDFLEIKHSLKINKKTARPSLSLINQL